MRLLIIFAAVSYISCGQNSSTIKETPPKGNTTKTSVDTGKIVPAVKDKPPMYTTPDEATVNEILTAKYGSEWHVLNDKEATWMKDAFDYFITPKRKEIPNYPYIAKGDYNADGREDIAAIVTNDLKSKYQIAIILKADNILFWKEDIQEDAAISAVPKSIIEGMEGEKIKKVKLKGDGINIEYFETASFIVYWDKTAFKRIQTGD